jgi:hypothetical protein
MPWFSIEIQRNMCAVSIVTESAAVQAQSVFRFPVFLIQDSFRSLQDFA